MLINFSKTLLSITGQILTDEKGEELRLGIIAANSLMSPQSRNDEPMSGAEQVKRFTLASQIVKCEEVDLTVEQITLIKERIAANYGPVITGPSWLLLDPPTLAAD